MGRMDGDPTQAEIGSRSGRNRALAGALAAAVALALLWAISRIESSLVFAPLAFAELLIRSTPGDVATFFIEELGKWAIRSLAIGVTATTVVLGALLARLGSRAPRWRSALAALGFGGFLLAAAFGANVDPSPPAALAVGMIGGTTYLVVLSWLLTTVPQAIAAETDLPRRRVLVGAASAAFGLALGGTLIGRLLESASTSEAQISPKLVEAQLPRRPPFPKVAGLSPEVTSAADHYVVDINLTKPVVDPASWRLTIDGLVDQPLELSFDDLQSRFGLVEEHSVLTCISNEVGGPLVGSSKWTGVRLSDVLAEAGLQDGARDLLLTAADGYTVTIRPDVATGPSALLAVAQDGEPLTVDHGAPCRLRVPQLYGMMNCKWLERIEAIDMDASGYWAQRGWSDTAIVKTQSRIDTVDPLPAAGATSFIAGVAWAGDRGISSIEVSTDGGRRWGKALLRPPISSLAWSQWAYEWTPPQSGLARIAVRATDGGGELQTEQRAAPHPAGATGYHEVGVEVA